MIEDGFSFALLLSVGLALALRAVFTSIRNCYRKHLPLKDLKLWDEILNIAEVDGKTLGRQEFGSDQCRQPNMSCLIYVWINVYFKHNILQEIEFVDGSLLKLKSYIEVYLEKHEDFTLSLIELESEAVVWKAKLRESRYFVF